MTPAAVLRYLTLPVQTAPLLLIAVLSVLLVVAKAAGLFGLPLASILLSSFFNYAFVVLDRVAEGAGELPVLSIEMVNPVSDHRSLVLLIAAVGLFYTSDAASYWMGAPLALASAIVVATIVPAIVAVQGATGSLLQSLNPRTFFGLMLRLRGDYLWILACVALFCLLRYAVTVPPLEDQPLMVRLALLLYAWLAVFALIGGVLFERRADIGLDAVSDVEPADVVTGTDAQTERVRDRQVDRIYAEWRGGAHANAWQTISAQLAESSDPIDELRWLHQRAALWPDTRLADRLARELLPRLLGLRQFGEALDIVRARLKANPRFRPASSADLLALVKLARDGGERPTARLLLQDFPAFYPDDPQQPAIDALTEQLAR